MQFLLLLSIFVIATCGLVYELVAGTLASYLLGDSVTQFSTIIGCYLFSMGIGSFLSKYVEKNVIRWFVQIEILVGFVGGISSSLLFLLFENVSSFRLILYLLIVITGTLVGMEIPLLLRILKDRLEFKELVSKVFTFDYIGALLASVIFPLWLVPHLGLIRTSFFFGIANVLVAYVFCSAFYKDVQWAIQLRVVAIITALVLLVGFVLSDRIMTLAEGMAYQDTVIFSKSSAYQRIVLTRSNHDLKLFLNGNLQFSSADEYRYHESLVHPAMSAIKNPQNVLVMGGGDGMAVREILKYPSVKNISLVDLDKAMTQLFSSNKMLMKLNDSSLLSSRVKITNEDAFEWLKRNRQQFDCIIVDFPDPSNYSLGKLYSTSFYHLLYKSLADSGALVIQSTSPLAAPKAFWCVAHTLEACQFHTLPYHAYVPSFGEWGYVIGMKNDTYHVPENYPANLRFLSKDVLMQLTNFPRDMAERPTEVNKLNNQALVNYFEEEWSIYAQ